MIQRWWVYQRERFPLFGHGPLVLAFSFSAVSFSSLLRGDLHWPRPAAALAAFLTCLIFFLQLRIADEFKDFEEDSRFRPYRPVPRGLVTLRELAVVFALGSLVQLGLALWLSPVLLTLLVVTWAYLALMSKEFFAREWLKGRPITYMLSHMLIMPLIDLYATACDWRLAGDAPSAGLVWFLVVSYSNGLAIEIGRKIRSPMDEEAGVETYSFLWGRRTSVLVWLGVLGLTALLAWKAASLIRFGGPVALVLGGLVALSAVMGLLFLRNPAPGRGKRFETLAGLWTLALYLGLGAVPMAFARWGGMP